MGRIEIARPKQRSRVRRVIGSGCGDMQQIETVLAQAEKLASSLDREARRSFPPEGRRGV